MADLSWRIKYILGQNENTPDDLDCVRCGALFKEAPRKGCAIPDRWLHRCLKRHGGGLERCALKVGECLLEDTEEKAKRLQVKLDALPLESHHVIKGLRKLHQHKNGWHTFTEFALLTRRVDLLAVRLYNSGPPLVIYEVKVSRSDWISELKNPDKRIEAQDTAAAFSFAAPKGLIAAEEVPDGCGLVEVHRGPRGAFHPMIVVPAPERPVTTVPTLYMSRMIWRLREAS